MDESKYGVHASHCCLRHGCKYADPQCPVVEEQIKQEYPCEMCDMEQEREDERDKQIKAANDIIKYVRINTSDDHMRDISEAYILEYVMTDKFS